MKKKLNNQRKSGVDPKKYNALIIGAGGQGAFADAPGSGNEHKIISFAHAIKNHKQTNTIAFYDKNHYKAKKASKIWNGINITDLNWCNTNYSDIIVIATPDESHYEYLLKIVDYNPKLVICEKPLCTDVNQAKEIVQLYKEKGISLMVDYTRRFIPELQELKQQYINGKLGKIKGIVGVYNKGLYHTGSHMYDFIYWMFKDKVGPYVDIVCFPDEYPDKCNYRIWSIQLFFEKYFWQEQRIFNMTVPSHYDYHMKYVVENACNFLEGKEKLICTGEESLKSLRLCNEILKNNNKEQ